MNENQVPSPSAAPASSSTLRPRYVVKRAGGGFEPLLGATSQAEAEERLSREVVGGSSQEIDMYAYVGTVRVKATAETVNIFEGT